MKDEILMMIYRYQNRLNGLRKETDAVAAGQRAAYNRVIAELKLLLEKCEESNVTE